MSPDAMFSFHNGLILLLCGLLSLIVPFSWAQQRSNKPDEFNCPEEFGYYPHPTDCTQYYVCVFGGALLESCTGGLMYSHDLQTCDWPRNVGCGISASETSTSSSSIHNANGINNSPGNEELQNRHTTSPWKYEPLQQQSQTFQGRQQQTQQQEEIPDRHLYEEENLGPAEEIENDRQQRVYRGQPPTLGQVARDRDGIVRHANALQTSAGPEKIKPVAMLSFNSLHNSLSKGITTEPLNFEQYIEESTDKFEGKLERHRLQRDLTNRPPPVSAPTYIIEQSPAAVPSTSKSAYNVSKYEPYYNVYDDDQDVYHDTDYGTYQNERKTPNSFQQALQKPQHRLQPQQQTQILNNSPTFTNQDYRLQSELVDSQQPEKLISSRGRNRGSVTYTTGGNEYDAVTSSAGGRTRPTLKPSTSIVSKSSETVDIYKYSPKRPDPVYPTPQVDKAAAKCRKDICLLPDCSCGGKDIPGDLTAEETPQIVLLTFDDSVNELNKGLYSDLFEKGRVNPNGCPISATFYVSHEWTDYSMVQNLYAAGHEIASHSVSHSFGEQFSQRKWTKEIVGQREILAAYGGVRQDDIRGMRAPFLAVGGNKMFKMLYDANFTYDSSMPIYENRPPSWPYTLDYKLFHDCMIPPCPTRSYPGVWEVPMVMWQDLNGGRCSMGDACSNPSNSDGVYKMLIKNFERHFTTNRAPFGLFYHSSWFTQPHHKEGFIAFLDTIVNMPEVWIITNWQAIQWARDPTPISRLNQFTPFNCDYPERPRRCNNPKVCNLWHKSGVRYLKTCQPCPDVYPWTGKTGVRNSRVDNDDTLTE